MWIMIFDICIHIRIRIMQLLSASMQLMRVINVDILIPPVEVMSILDIEIVIHLLLLLVNTKKGTLFIDLQFFFFFFFFFGRGIQIFIDEKFLKPLVHYHAKREGNLHITLSNNFANKFSSRTLFNI
jgi:hypothetical protein